MLLAHALDRFWIEARLVDRQRQKLDCRLPVDCEGFEAAVECIARFAEAHAQRKLFHALLEACRREVAGPLVENA